MATMEKQCTFLISNEGFNIPKTAEIQKALESKNVEERRKAVKHCIMLAMMGEDTPELLMTVIRFCILTRDHEEKKLLMLYWEIVNKYDENNKLLPQMILVCNALRKDLLHPNEYIRGCTLRFLCKLKEPELLESLIPAIRDNISHRHPYVRRNAALTVYTLYKEFGADLLPDAPADMEKLLEDETDASARRNAFIMLFNCAQDKALSYFQRNLDKVMRFGDGFQLVVLELIRKITRTDPTKRARFVKVIFSLLSSTSPSVAFEAANTLVSMSNASAAVKAAASSYSQLLSTQSDNNVRLIILDRMEHLAQQNKKVVQEHIMDILRTVTSQNQAIREKAIDITLSLVTSKSIEDVLGFLKKEIVSAQADSDASDSGYKSSLIEAIHECAMRFPSAAADVVLLLLDFLGSDGALKIISFVREMLEMFPNYRRDILRKLVEVLPDVRKPDIFFPALWILGQYSESKGSVKAAFTCLRHCIGPLPLTRSLEADAAAPAEPETPKSDKDEKVKGPKVLADGTYASQAAVTESPKPGFGSEVMPPLRRFILKGHFPIAAALATTMTKLALRTGRLFGVDSREAKAVTLDALLLMCAILQYGELVVAEDPVAVACAAAAKKAQAALEKGSSSSSNNSSHPLKRVTFDEDSYEKICQCMRMLDGRMHDVASTVMLDATAAAFSDVTLTKRREREEEKNAKLTKRPAIVAQPDDIIGFRQLRGTASEGPSVLDLDDEADISRAAGLTSSGETRFQRVHQFTGFGDPLYAEALVTVHDYDILLDISIVNRTQSTLTNVTMELATKGDLKVVDKPHSFALEAGGRGKVKANIKVSSTDSAHIYGIISYETSRPVEKKYIHLNGIAIDIMDYIHPAFCSGQDFRKMWAEFEWENKLLVTTSIPTLDEYLDHIIKITNMRRLTPRGPRDPNKKFLTSNLYAKSVFGEDALLNVSVEKDTNGKIKGAIRIRSKTQGVAVSLGDCVTSKQKHARYAPR